MGAIFRSIFDPAETSPNLSGDSFSNPRSTAVWASAFTTNEQFCQRKFTTVLALLCDALFMASSLNQVLDYLFCHPLNLNIFGIDVFHLFVFGVQIIGFFLCVVCKSF